MVIIMIINSKKHRLHKLSLLTFGIACALSFSATGYAQQENDQISEEDGELVLEQIVVTGSRIPRRGFESLQASTVLDSEEIGLNNTFNISDLLNEQSGFVALGNTPAGGQAADSVGQNFANYLGLGPQRTLTLVNGQRFPSGASPTNSGGLSVDLNAIPELLIERVETIAIGGAPIYGSDAIAGTVNIILKDDYEGTDFTVSVGGSTEYDFEAEYRVGGSWGKNFADGRGNVAVAASHSFRPGLKFVDRDQTSQRAAFYAPADPNSPFQNQLFPDTVVAVDNVRPFPLFAGNQFGFGIFGNGVPVSAAPGAPLAQFDADGNLLPFVPGGGTGSVVFQNGGDGLRLSEFTSLYTDTERSNFNVFANYDLTDNVKLKGEFWFARTDATEVVNQPLYNSPAFGGLPGNNWGNVGAGPIPVLINNPFLPAATRDAIQASLNLRQDADGDGLADPTIDTNGDGVPDAVGFWRGGPLIGIFGDAPNSSVRDTTRLVLGLEGEIEMAGKPFTWDAGVTFGKTESDDKSLFLIQTRFDQAVRVVPDANGNAVCQDPSNGCVPLNVIGTATPEAIAYVAQNVVDKVEVEQTVLSANIGGELFELPAGAVGFAGGITYRKESSDFNPNDFAETGQGRVTVNPVSGSFDSKEIYVETKIPLLGGDMGGIDSLDFEAAARYVDNSIAGSDVTWTAGLRFAPVSDIEFRGNITEAIRAPSIRELFTPTSATFGFANDPCDQRFIGQGNFPGRRAANCSAAGIAQPFNSFIATASQQGTVSGNTNLANEIAESTSFGFVTRPSFIDGFTMSMDWFDIELTQAIESLTVQDLMIACYDSDNFPNEPACSRFQRDGAGQVVGFQSGFVNVGLVEFRGMQASMDYVRDMGNYGNLRLSMNHLNTKQYDETPGSGNTDEQAGEIGYSKRRTTASLTWSKDKWTVFNQFRLLDSAVFDNSDEPNTRDVKGIDSFFVVDTGVQYQVNDNLAVQLNIDNLLNEKAPYGATIGGVGTYLTGILERYATITIKGSY